jgi:hypothetical protein
MMSSKRSAPTAQMSGRARFTPTTGDVPALQELIGRTVHGTEVRRAILRRGSPRRVGTLKP